MKKYLLFFVFALFKLEFIFGKDKDVTKPRDGVESSFNKMSGIIDSVLNSDSVSTSISSGQIGVSSVLYTLCGLVFVWQMSSIAIKNLLRAGDGFSWEEFKKPGLLLIILSGWGLLDTFIRETVSNAMVEYVKEEQFALVKEQNKVMANFKKIDEYLDSLETNTDTLDSDSGFFDLLGMKELINRVRYLDDFILFSVIKSTMETCAFFDVLIYIGFEIVTKIWLKIVGMGGALALTVSAFSGGWTAVINWAKTYVSVSLWLPVTSYIINLVNMILVKMMALFVTAKTLAVENAVGDKASETANQVINFGNNIHSAMLLATSSLAIIICGIVIKLVLLGKVPNMISGWLSGGGSAGSGFGMAFMPISAAKTVASAVATKGASLLK